MNQDLPAVIVCAGAHRPALNKLPEIIKRYSKSIFVGVDRGAWELIQANYHLDLAIGDFDSISLEQMQMIKKQSNKCKIYQSDKDDTDTELAFCWIQEYYPSSDIYVLGGLGQGSNRLDHLIANLYMVYQPRFRTLLKQTQFIEKDHKIAWLGSGEHILYPDSNYPEYLSIIAMTPIEGLTIEDAKYNLRPTELFFPRAFISNEFISMNQPVKLSLTKGIMMIMWVKEKER